MYRCVHLKFDKSENFFFSMYMFMNINKTIYLLNVYIYESICLYISFGSVYIHLFHFCENVCLSTYLYIIYLCISIDICVSI